MVKRKNRNRLSVLLGLLFLLAAGISVIWIQRSLKESEDRTIHAMETISQGLRGDMLTLKRKTEQLSRHLTRNGTLTADSNHLTEYLKNNPDLYGIGIAKEPTAGTTERTSMYYTRTQNARKINRVKIPYDYTEEKQNSTQWYTQPRRERKALWIGPYFGEAAQASMVTYSIPVLNAKGEFLGVIFAEYSLAQIQHHFRSTDARQGPPAILITAQGRITSHPRLEKIQNEQTLTNIAERTGRTELIELAERIADSSRSGHLTLDTSFTQEKATLYYTRIPDLNWYILTIIPDPLKQISCYYQRPLFILTLTLTILLTCILVLQHSHRPQLLSFMLTLTYMLGTLGLVGIAIRGTQTGICEPYGRNNEQNLAETPRSTCQREALANEFTFGTYLNRCLTVDRKIIGIPTGLIVQTLQFRDAYTFEITGYIWQRYRKRADTSILGVEFPESVEEELTKIYDDSLGENRYVRGWRYQTTIRQPFSYRKYPIDKQEIWLRMRPQGLTDTLLLEPDFESHQGTALLGADPNLTLPQWNLLSTNYSYTIQNAGTRYGRTDSTPPATNVELHYSLHVGRSILDAVISQFIPLVVILIMLYAILWISRSNDRKGLLGFDSLSGISGCSALFFIVIYNHISIRTTLGAQGVMYIEIYFFTSYISLLAVSLNSILIGTGLCGKITAYRDNYLARLIYWPTIFGSNYIGTLLFLY